MNSFLNFGRFLLASFVMGGNINTPIKGTKVPTTTTSEIMTSQPWLALQSSQFSCHIIVAFSHFLFREMTLFFVTFFFFFFYSQGIFSRYFSLSNSKIQKDLYWTLKTQPFRFLKAVFKKLDISNLFFPLAGLQFQKCVSS